MVGAADSGERAEKPRTSKIGVLGLRGFPNVMGGIESHCGQLYTRLSKTTDRKFLVLARSAYKKDAETIDDGLEVRPVWSLRNKYLEAVVHTAWGTLLLIFHESPDLIHLHAIGPGLFTPFAKLSGKPVIVTHHGRDFDRPKWNSFAKLVLRFGEWLSVKFADRVIVVSRSVAESLKAKHPKRADKIVHIPNGATQLPSDPELAGEAMTRFSLRPSRYILSVGRLEPSKGFHDLIAAFKQADTEMKLVIAGGADHDDAYSRGLLAETSDRIVFTGMQPPAVLQALYANASLFVLASSHEGLPIVVLEAVMAGAPVLMSDIQPNEDLDFSGIHYFPLHDTAALARKLESPHGIFRVSRNTVSENYDWDRVAEQTEEVYRAVLAQ